jgi:hypothetical protein
MDMQPTEQSLNYASASPKSIFESTLLHLPAASASPIPPLAHFTSPRSNSKRVLFDIKESVYQVAPTSQATTQVILDTACTTPINNNTSSYSSLDRRSSAQKSVRVADQRVVTSTGVGHAVMRLVNEDMDHFDINMEESLLLPGFPNLLPHTAITDAGGIIHLEKGNHHIAFYRSGKKIRFRINETRTRLLTVPIAANYSPPSTPPVAYYNVGIKVYATTRKNRTAPELFQAINASKDNQRLSALNQLVRRIMPKATAAKKGRPPQASTPSPSPPREPADPAMPDLPPEDQPPDAGTSVIDLYQYITRDKSNRPVIRRTNAYQLLIETLEDMHYSLGHMDYAKMIKVLQTYKGVKKSLASQLATANIEKLLADIEKHGKCVLCARSKAKTIPHPATSHLTKNPLANSGSMDLIKLQPTSRQGNNYALSYIELVHRFKHVRFQKARDSEFTAENLNNIAVHLKEDLKALHGDYEYMNGAVARYCKDNHILLSSSTPHIKEQHGLIEKMHQDTLLLYLLKPIWITFTGNTLYNMLSSCSTSHLAPHLEVEAHTNQSLDLNLTCVVYNNLVRKWYFSIIKRPCQALKRRNQCRKLHSRVEWELF